MAGEIVLALFERGASAPAPAGARRFRRSGPWTPGGTLGKTRFGEGRSRDSARSTSRKIVQAKVPRPNPRHAERRPDRGVRFAFRAERACDFAICGHAVLRSDPIPGNHIEGSDVKLGNTARWVGSSARFGRRRGAIRGKKRVAFNAGDSDGRGGASVVGAMPGEFGPGNFRSSSSNRNRFFRTVRGEVSGQCPPGAVQVGAGDGISDPEGLGDFPMRIAR